MTALANAPDAFRSALRSVCGMSDITNPPATPEQIEPGGGSVFLGCPDCGFVTTVPGSRLGPDRSQDPYCEHTDGPPLWKGKPGRYAARMLRVTVHVVP